MRLTRFGHSKCVFIFLAGCDGVRVSRLMPACQRVLIWTWLPPNAPSASSTMLANLGSADLSPSAVFQYWRAVVFWSRACRWATSHPEDVASDAGELSSRFLTLRLSACNLPEHLDPRVGVTLAGFDAAPPVVEDLETHHLLARGLCRVRFRVPVKPDLPPERFRHRFHLGVQDVAQPLGRPSPGSGD